MRDRARLIEALRSVNGAGILATAPPSFWEADCYRLADMCHAASYALEDFKDNRLLFRIDSRLRFGLPSAYIRELLDEAAHYMKEDADAHKT